MKWSEVKFGCYEKFVFSFFYLNFIYFPPTGKTIYDHAGPLIFFYYSFTNMSISPIIFFFKTTFLIKFSNEIRITCHQNVEAEE